MTEGIRWDRMERLYQHVLLSGSRFKIQNWFDGKELRKEEEEEDFNWCGTTACLAGHAVTLFKNYLWVEEPSGATRIVTGDDVEEVAKKWLGLSAAESDWLFCAITNRAALSTRVVGGWRSRFFSVPGDVTDEAAALTYMKACIEAREMIPPWEFFEERRE